MTQPVIVGGDGSERAVDAAWFAAEEELLAFTFAESPAGRRNKEPDVVVREVVARHRPARALVAVVPPSPGDRQ